MQNKEDWRIKQLLESEQMHASVHDKQNLRDTAKNNILSYQERARTQYNKKRKEPTVY